MNKKSNLSSALQGSKRLCAFTALLIIVLFCSVWLVNTTIKATKMNGSGPLSGKVIVIDAGHGGDDPGVWDKTNNIKEKDINLAVSLRLKDLLTAAGASVTLIRDRDTDYILHWRIRGGQSRKRSDLDRRIEMAKNARADILVSLHVNASPKTQYGGAEAFYFPQSADGKLLAESIQKQLRLIPGMVKRIPKTGNYYLLHHSPMPAVIVEIGYLTNHVERKKLVTGPYQQQLTRAIALGIADYFRDYPNAGTPPATGKHPQSPPMGSPLRKGEATLYFRPLDNTSALLQGHKLDLDVPAAAPPKSLAQTVMERLLQGPQSDTASATPFPPGTRLRSVEIAQGKATVDLSNEIRDIAGSQEEKAALYSIVASLLSLPGIDGVNVLVEGQPVETLAGHIDTRHTLSRLTGLYQTSDGVLLEGERPLAAIVIDDVGTGTREETRELLDLKIPVTLAILPGTPVSGVLAREAARHGHQVILHLPMEASTGPPSWIGKGAITVGLSDAEIEQRFATALKSVPGAIGFNNHMGSRITGDYRLVKLLLNFASQRGLFVLDSRTTMSSMIPRAARELGVPYAERTVFLDGRENTGQVERQLHLLAMEAQKRGIAVGIGHVGPESRQTVKALQKAASVMEAAGVQLVFLSEVVK